MRYWKVLYVPRKLVSFSNFLAIMEKNVMRVWGGHLAVYHQFIFKNMCEDLVFGEKWKLHDYNKKWLRWLQIVILYVYCTRDQIKVTATNEMFFVSIVIKSKLLTFVNAVEINLIYTFDNRLAVLPCWPQIFWQQ